MSLALAGRFFTTEPPGKFLISFRRKNIKNRFRKEVKNNWGEVPSKLHLFFFFSGLIPRFVTFCPKLPNPSTIRRVRNQVSLMLS